MTINSTVILTLHHALPLLKKMATQLILDADILKLTTNYIESSQT